MQVDDESEATASLAHSPEVASLAWKAAARPAPPGLDERTAASLTTAADAMRNEEIERTRLFIVMGWVISVIAAATTLFVASSREMAIAFNVGLAIGMVYSYAQYRAFADPQRYAERKVLRLATICVINGHIGVMYFGVYSATPMLVVVGIHFIGRTELTRVARWAFASALACYTVISILVISGAVSDPGVFASDRDVPRTSLVAASLFVLGTYVLAYYTARTFRTASLSSIDELQRATRLASQREALMEELRADLERALQVGGPGRYSDQRIGDYKLGIVLGRGAMGEVYEATHTGTGERAAVKLLRREQLADPTQVTRFWREVEASAAAASPHIVRVLAASEPDDGVPYLVMERLTGQTLGEMLRREPRLSHAATLELVRHVALGIDAVAATGIVHRDLKPQNLFLASDGTWKILDFGVAALESGTGTLTRGEAVGTPHYMAPEQAQGLRVDSRADQYALAAIAYRCLTGRYPFTATDTPALLYAVVHRTPARPGALADLPADVDRYFALALAKKPDDRFATAREVADAFATALEGRLAPALRKRADALVRKQPWSAA